MDMRLGVEPWLVIFRRHCEYAIKQCNGSIGNASQLLGIGRATLYRHVKAWEKEGPCPVSPYADSSSASVSGPSHNPLLDGWLDRPTPKALWRRRRVERLLEGHGSVSETASAIGVSRAHLDRALVEWRELDERRARECARREGILPIEIDVIFGRCKIERYALESNRSTKLCYEMIDEALHILGLRRSGRRLALAPPKSEEELEVQHWRTTTDSTDELEVMVCGSD